MTLGRRLILLSALAVGATVVLACAGAYLATRGALRGQIDDSLRAQAHAIQVRAGVRPADEPPPLPGEPRPTAGLASGFIQLVRPDGTPTCLRGDDVHIPVTKADVVAARRQRHRAPSSPTATGDGVHLRVITVPLPGHGRDRVRPLAERRRRRPRPAALGPARCCASRAPRSPPP